MLKAFLTSLAVAAVLGFMCGIISFHLGLSEDARRLLGLAAGIGVYMSIMSPAINEKFNKRELDQDDE